PFREDLFWVMDYDYWLRILCAGGRVGFVDTELAAFRIQPNQKSTQPRRTAEELLQVVRPYIFAKDPSVSRSKRIELKGKWTFDAEFQKVVELSTRLKEERWRRWLRLAWFSIRHPYIFTARSFRKRLLSSIARSNSNVAAAI